MFSLKLPFLTIDTFILSHFFPSDSGFDPSTPFPGPGVIKALSNRFPFLNLLKKLKYFRKCQGSSDLENYF